MSRGRYSRKKMLAGEFGPAVLAHETATLVRTGRGEIAGVVLVLDPVAVPVDTLAPLIRECCAFALYRGGERELAKQIAAPSETRSRRHQRMGTA